MRRHHGRLQQVAAVGNHHDRCFYDGHDAATQARDDHDSPATAGDHPAAGAGL